MLKEGLKTLGIAVLFLLGLEAAIRVAYSVRNGIVEYVVIPYTAAQDFGPVPPWMDGLRILEPDDSLSWRNRRNAQRTYLDVYSPVRFEKDRTDLLQRFFPGTPDYLHDNPVWTVSVNSLGFRGPEFPAAKALGSFRIVCIGDSWTFGANVDQADAWPQRLASRLERAFPGRGFEVLNLGVMGYSSYQGLQLLERTGLALDPDVVVIGFGMNDALVGGWRDKDRTVPTPSRTASARQLAGRIEIIKLLRYIYARMNREPWSIGNYMTTLAESVGTLDHAWNGGPASEQADYEALEPYTRVSPVDYESNIREMTRLTRSRGATAVVLYNSLWDTPYRDAAQRVARTDGVPLVDSKALLDEARAGIETGLERRLDLVPTASEPGDSLSVDVEVIFRVYADPVETTIYIAGTHPALGDATPNRVAMRDDGTGGDQRAGDDVWSYMARLPAGATVYYVYTNSGEPGRWEGMDVPDLRRLIVPNQPGRTYRPIDTFGEFYLQADGWHTNARGYEMIAEAVFEALLREPKVEAHLGAWAGSVSDEGR